MQIWYLGIEKRHYHGSLYISRTEGRAKEIYSYESYTSLFMVVRVRVWYMGPWAILETPLTFLPYVVCHHSMVCGNQVSKPRRQWITSHQGQSKELGDKISALILLSPLRQDTSSRLFILAPILVTVASMFDLSFETFFLRDRETIMKT